MTDCIFCKISNKEIPATVVHEEKDLIAFKDIHPKAPVHLLIIPKQHIESIAHLQAEHESIAGRLLFAAKEIAERAGLKGYKLVFNVGREGGQVIDHLHLHLMGGWKNGEGLDK